MAIKKIKISELPIVSSLVELYTIGVDALNRSVKVSLQFIKDAADAANSAAASATNAASSATTAANNANSKANAANSAAESASNAAGAANTAAGNANAKAAAANLAAEAATAAATSANTAAESVNAAKNAATQATTAANNAATSANSAATSASQAATAANGAATNANSKAGLADQKASDANNAAVLANQKAQLAQETVDRLEELADSLVGEYKLIPTDIELDYPTLIPYVGQQFGRIIYRLLPEDVGRNVLFLPGGGDSVMVYPNGEYAVKGMGITTVHVIPTENTAIYKTIQISVVQPSLRKAGSGAIRLTGGGGMRI